MKNGYEVKKNEQHGDYGVFDKNGAQVGYNYVKESDAINAMSRIGVKVVESFGGLVVGGCERRNVGEVNEAVYTARGWYTGD